jgi:hypothetical protein
LRKNTIILFFVALIVLQASINCLFEVIKECHKENIIENVLTKLPTTYLTKIDASTNNFIWIENGKEFVLNGNMYDIVKFEKINNHTIYYCFSDKDEDALLKKYDELNNESKPVSSSSPKHSDHFTTIDLLFTAFPSLENAQVYSSVNKLNHFDENLKFPSFSGDILIPPPQFS